MSYLAFTPLGTLEQPWKGLRKMSQARRLQVLDGERIKLRASQRKAARDCKFSVTPEQLAAPKTGGEYRYDRKDERYRLK